ncbi:MAG: PAS domain S-box protein [Candidatus Cloacimonetes bacterium]|nr:PAS domain S-box protein [Candidatus Cloacimonadota bacterium]
MRGEMVFRELIQNMLLLIVFSYLYSIIYRFREKTHPYLYNILSGLLFGSIAILGMIFPFVFTEGVVFDGRSIIIFISGMFGGPVTSLIASIMTVCFRILMGGAGAGTGTGVILSSALTGVIFYYLIKSERVKCNTFNIYLFGLFVHIVMILWMFTLPQSVRFNVLNNITIPVLIIYPLVTVLIAGMLADQEHKAEMEANLLNSRKRLEAAQGIARMGHWEYNLKTGDFITSGGLRKILHFPADYRCLRLEELRQYIVIADRETVNAAYEEAKKQQKPCNLEYRMQTGDKNEIYVNEICQTEYDEAMHPLRQFGIIQDISSRKEAELKLQQSEERYRSLFRSIRDALIIIDQQQHIIDCNPTFSDLFGYDCDEIRNRELNQIFTEHQFQELSSHPETFQLVTRSFLTKAGRRFAGEIKVSQLITNDLGTGFIIMIRDVTIQQETATRLDEYKNNLEEKIKERTHQLEDKNKELRELNAVFIGREFRIKELREKIKEMESRNDA